MERLNVSSPGLRPRTRSLPAGMSRPSAAGDLRLPSNARGPSSPGATRQLNGTGFPSSHANPTPSGTNAVIAVSRDDCQRNPVTSTDDDTRIIFLLPFTRHWCKKLFFARLKYIVTLLKYSIH